MSLSAYPDLTKRPPRSPRVRLGGYAILPRMLDKGRATIAGKNGEYNFACPMDGRVLEFMGVTGAEVRTLLEEGKSDSEVLDWIGVNARNQHSYQEILAWSTYQDNRMPSDVDGLEFFTETLKSLAPNRTDIASWFDLLDLDDHVSFGGRP